MSKLTFKESPRYVAEVFINDEIIGSIREVEGRYFYVGHINYYWLTRKDVARISKYMKSLRAANLPKTKADDSGPVVTGTLNVEQPQTVAFPNFDPVRQATVAFPESDPVRKVVMPGTASIRFVVEGRNYTINLNGLLTGDEASVEYIKEPLDWRIA